MRKRTNRTWWSVGDGYMYSCKFWLNEWNWLFRIHIYLSKWLLACEIHSIAMNFKSTGTVAHLSKLHQCYCKTELTTKMTQTKLRGIFRNTGRMMRRSSIGKIHVPYWIWFAIHNTTNFIPHVMVRQWASCMLTQFANQQMTLFQTTCIQFQVTSIPFQAHT
jgi:hypothetical protein